jgi:CDP-diacylglycerol--glycerol-3-phosphate 3-phosphatidyltransferase
MPSIYDIKPKFQALLRPITNKLAAVGVTANHVTLAAAVLSIITGVAIFIGREHRPVLLLLPIVLFVRMALNAIDGMLAREHNMKSALGAILNELGDVISDSALYLPLAYVPGFKPFFVVLVVLLSVISELAGVVAVQIGASRHYEGPMGKSDRAFVFGALGLVLGLNVPPGEWVNIVLAGMILLLLLTIWNRSRKALQEIKP